MRLTIKTKLAAAFGSFLVLIAVFVLPIYYKLKVYTAYEFLENRFDLRMRSLTASLFLLQRGISAAISIYAPSLRSSEPADDPPCR